MRRKVGDQSTHLHLDILTMVAQRQMIVQHRQGGIQATDLFRPGVDSLLHHLQRLQEGH